MHMFYDIVLTMPLVHLNCRKGHVQPTTRKEGRDLFRRTSDDNSINRDIMTKERASERGRSTSKDEDHHGYERSYDKRVTINHEE